MVGPDKHVLHPTPFWWKFFCLFFSCYHNNSQNKHSFTQLCTFQPDSPVLQCETTRRDALHQSVDRWKQKQTLNNQSEIIQWILFISSCHVRATERIHSAHKSSSSLVCCPRHVALKRSALSVAVVAAAAALFFFLSAAASSSKALCHSAAVG